MIIRCFRIEGIITEKAKKTDAAEVVRLISLADKDAVMTLSGKDYINDALAEYELNFGRDDVYFSYRNIFIARDKKKIAGCILWFSGEDESSFSSLTGQKPEMENESEPGEIYIDSLAVLSEYRGRGIASLLIDQVTAEARRKRIRKVTLLADTKKPYLKKLYQKSGFDVTSEMTLLNDHYEKMTFHTSV
ncbi:GNAT family N-acetyltransferase [Klebsiella oxytoca]|uniref:GNAT family N-acetyltransferase n=1 Tax=Klebsiella oxytoca TaxID=571 RepID=UPI001EEA56EB|nr:GNAT family N-acetyltransferase [Klebsiella oxytoca]